MVLDIQSETDRIICHFRPFFFLVLLPPIFPPNDPKKSKFWKILSILVYHKWTSYDIWFLKFKVRQTEIFVILGQFWPFQPPDNPENQNFKIEKIASRYYHFTHFYHTWQSYDIYFLRYMECEGQKFLSFWTVSCPFTCPPPF